MATKLNWETRQESIRLHGYIELKLAPSQPHGLLFHPAADTIYIDASERSEACSATIFTEPVIASGAINKIKFIALHKDHKDYDEFLETFKLYNSLEVVLLVAGG